MNLQLFSLSCAFCALALVSTASTNSLTDHIDDAEVVASLAQSHQLDLALALFNFKFGHYPEVESDELTSTLFDHGFLNEPRSLGQIEYQVSKNGSSYTLAVK